MATGVGKSSKIRKIVRLRQMLRRWRSRALPVRIPADVPAGHVAVCVGTNSKRFVVRASLLNHPLFKKLLLQAEEEYGFANRGGPLAIPCDESVFEDILRFVTRNDSWVGPTARSLNPDDLRRCSHLGARKMGRWIESRPLLAENSAW